MSRKNRAPKRDVLPDPLYNSQLVTRLINRVMLDGKRGTAASIVYGAFEQIKEATGNDALEVFETAMKTSCLYLKYVLAVSVVLTTKFQRSSSRTSYKCLDFVGW